MKRFSSLLLPLDGSHEAAKAASCALWLAQTLDATLHVLYAATQPLPENDALRQLHAPHVQRPQVVLHQLPAHANAAVLEAITSYAVDLVVMSARGESVSTGHKLPQELGHVAQAVIEGSPVPVLLLPLRYREALPWTSVLAAANGEMAAENAIEAAAQLAAALGLKLTVMYAENGAGAMRTTPLGAYADAAHHEYPLRMQGMVERGLAGCTSEECGCFDRALVRHGDPAAMLLEQVARQPSSVLAVGWHGALGPGRALVLKRLLEQAECPLLLVRKVERSTARLKVGEEIDD